MKKARRAFIFFGIVFGFLAFLSLVFFSTQKKAGFALIEGEELFSSKDITHIEILWKNERIELNKTQEGWRSESSLDLPPVTVNENFLNHFLDLLESLGQKPRKSFSEYPESHSFQYGVNSPTLGINFGNPHTQESLIFGSLGSNHKTTWLYIPRLRSLFEVPAVLHEFLSGHSVLDFLNLKMTSFSTDAIEELATKGQCKTLQILRDGAQWKLLKGTLSLDVIDEYLEGLTGVKGRGFKSHFIVSKNLPVWCELYFLGRKGRQEKISIFKQSSGQLIAVKAAEIETERGFALLINAADLNLFL